MANKIYVFFLLAPMIIGLIPIDGFRHFKSDDTYIIIINSAGSERTTELYEITMGELVFTKDQVKQHEGLVRDTIVIVNSSFKQILRQATFQNDIYLDGEVEKFLGYGENQHVPYFYVTDWKVDKYIPLNRRWTRTDWILISSLFIFGLALLTFKISRKTKSTD